jgi:hypothetical protein
MAASTTSSSSEAARHDYQPLSSTLRFRFNSSLCRFHVQYSSLRGGKQSMPRNLRQ